MQIVPLPIEKIVPYQKNAKVHPESQIKKIAASIVEFGFNQPVVVDENNVIIVGHGRYLAAKHLNLKTVPTLVLNVDEQRAKAYRLADNKLNESKWEMELVIEELKSISLEMVDLTGFDRDLILETKEDFPDLGPSKGNRTILGDIYELGRHRVICGDSTSAQTYSQLLGNEKARMIFTDPPYGVDYVPREGGEYNNTERKLMNDDLNPEQAGKFFAEIAKRLHEFSTDDVTVYWWYASRLQPINEKALADAQWHVSQIVLWLKNSMIYSPGQLFHRIYEPCMVGWKKGKSPYRDRSFSSFTELWTLDQKKFADYLDIWYQKRDNTTKYIHPTQKPVQLAERALKRSSEKNDIILDAFGGSGSTMMACEQLDRNARLIELDPKYVDAIVGRWVAYTDNPHVIKNGEEIVW